MKKDELEELFDLTNHRGWKLLIEDVQGRVKVIKEGLGENELTGYQQGVLHGHIKVYNELVILRDMVEQSIKFMTEEEDSTDEQAAAI